MTAFDTVVETRDEKLQLLGGLESLGKAGRGKEVDGGYTHTHTHIYMTFGNEKKNKV